MIGFGERKQNLGESRKLNKNKERFEDRKGYFLRQGEGSSEEDGEV